MSRTRGATLGSPAVFVLLFLLTACSSDSGDESGADVEDTEASKAPPRPAQRGGARGAPRPPVRKPSGPPSRPEPKAAPRRGAGGAVALGSELSGRLDSVSTAGVVTGWACDSNAVLNAVEVRLFVGGAPGSPNGAYVGSARANGKTNDDPAIPCPGNHGFQFELPEDLRDGGQHELFAYGMAFDGLSSELLTGAPARFQLQAERRPARTAQAKTAADSPQRPVVPRAKLGTDVPVGLLENVTDQGDVWGWAFDPSSSSSPVEIRFFVDAPVDARRPAAGSASANQRRKDLSDAGYAGDHGFAFRIPKLYHDLRPHYLYAYAISRSGEALALEGSPWRFTMGTPTARGFLDGVTEDGEIYGWAYDPGAPLASVEIRFHLDGPANDKTARFAGKVLANAERKDVNAALGITGNHGFGFHLPAFARDDRLHMLYVSTATADGRVGTVAGSPRQIRLRRP